MRRAVAARLLESLIVVVLVTTISFFLVRLAPGDPFAYEGRNITPAIRDYWRHQFGYDRPLPEQYLRYATSVLHGQFGYSQTLHRPVSAALADAVPRTVLLAGVSLLLSFGLGIAAGVVQAAKRGSRTDKLLSGVLLCFYSLPDFWLAIIMLLGFAYWLPLFPPGGIVDPVLHDYMSAGAAFMDRVRHMVLPVATLTLLVTAAIARYQRTAMLDVLPMEYVQLARAKGLSERQVVWRHALRTALTPVIMLFGLLLPALVGGDVFVEAVFGWPGMGLLTADAIVRRDYDLLTASVLVGAVLVVAGNIIADLLHMLVDPRLRDARD